jgi:hypothetical protein
MRLWAWLQVFSSPVVAQQRAQDELEREWARETRRRKAREAMASLGKYTARPKSTLQSLEVQEMVSILRAFRKNKGAHAHWCDAAAAMIEHLASRLDSAPVTTCYDCAGPLNGPYCPACAASARVTDDMVERAAAIMMQHGLNAPEQVIYQAARAALLAALKD